MNITHVLQQLGPFCDHLVFMGDLKHHDICWWDKTEGCKQTRRLLQCVDDNLLLQATEESTRRGGVVDLQGEANRKCEQGQPQ